METMVKMPSRQEALYATMHSSHMNYMNLNQGIRRLRQWIDVLKDEPMRILEVGCGNGLLCKALSSMGYMVTGIDLVPGSYSRYGYDFVLHDLQEPSLPFDDDSFDLCVCFDVIEHLELNQVNNLLPEMKRVSGGNVVGTAACFASAVLHLTVEDAEWWKAKVSETLDCDFLRYDGPAGATVLFKSKEKVC